MTPEEQQAYDAVPAETQALLDDMPEANRAIYLKQIANNQRIIMAHQLGEHAILRVLSDELTADQIESVHNMLKGIWYSADPKSMAAQWCGIISAFRQTRFDICIHCAEKHEELDLSKMESGS
jgi:hypothetical protein